MILNYHTIKNQASELNGLLKSPAQIQKIYSSSRLISMAFRIPGKTMHLYLGRGSGYEGAFLYESPLESEVRTKDKFLDYLRKYLSGALIEKVEVDSKDRILRLDLIVKSKRIQFYFFWKGRELYFANSFEKGEKMVSYTSWSGFIDIPLSFETFDVIGRKDLTQGKMSQEFSPVEIIKSEKLILSDKTQRKTQVKKKKRLLSNILKDISKLNTYKELQEFLLGEKSHEELEEKSIHKTSMLNIKLPKDISGYKKRDFLFNKVKSYKKAIELQQERLSKAEKSEVTIEQNNIVTIKPIWNVKKAKSPQVNTEFETYDLVDSLISIGRDSKENDAIRKLWANKDDYWFHLDDQTSPHIILKLKNKQDLISEYFDVISALFIAKLNLKTDEVDVIYTQVKNLKGVKGKSGSVRYSKEKHIRIHNIKPWESYLSELSEY
jgi:predicted ribosome quality control (RQC) complex YloA/Tae2 family protein